MAAIRRPLDLRIVWQLAQTNRAGRLIHIRPCAGRIIDALAQHHGSDQRISVKVRLAAPRMAGGSLAKSVGRHVVGAIVLTMVSQEVLLRALHCMAVVNGSTQHRVRHMRQLS